MVRKKKESNPFLVISELMERFDFIEEVYPEVEYNIEWIPVSVSELDHAAGLFEKTDLGFCMKQLRDFIGELQKRRCLIDFELIGAYRKKEQAVLLCRQETSMLQEIPKRALTDYYSIRIESLKRANEMAERAYNQAGSYRRQMRGKQLMEQSKSFITVLKQEISEMERRVQLK